MVVEDRKLVSDFGAGGYLKSLHNGELRSYSQASKHISDRPFSIE